MSEEKVPNYAIHNDKEIRGFFGPYRFLSNFWVTPIHFEGWKYPSVENAYQAAKTEKIEERRIFTTAINDEMNLTAGQAKRAGQGLKIRLDWETIKYDTMAVLVFDKFYRNIVLRDLLLRTSSKYLEERNAWKDRTWGVDLDEKGTNWLGLILMKVRDFWQPN